MAKPTPTDQTPSGDQVAAPPVDNQAAPPAADQVAPSAAQPDADQAAPSAAQPDADQAAPSAAQPDADQAAPAAAPPAAPEVPAKHDFLVTSRLDHNQVTYWPGDKVSLTESQAKPLLGGCITPAD